MASGPFGSSKRTGWLVLKRPIVIVRPSVFLIHFVGDVVVVVEQDAGKRWRGGGGGGNGILVRRSSYYPMMMAC